MSPSAGPPAGGSSSEGRVALAGESSATSLFGRILLEAADRFPEAFSAVRLPTQPSAFRKTYGQVLPAFEAARFRGISESRREIRIHSAGDGDPGDGWIPFTAPSPTTDREHT